MRLYLAYIEGFKLVVEDNKTNRLLIEMMLEDFEITCDFENDGFEAIKLL